MLSPNYYMFRHQSAILKELNNNKGWYFGTKTCRSWQLTWMVFYGLSFILIYYFNRCVLLSNIWNVRKFSVWITQNSPNFNLWNSWLTLTKYGTDIAMLEGVKIPKDCNISMVCTRMMCSGRNTSATWNCV